MEPWIPLFQSLVWPVIVALVLVIFGSELRGIIVQIRDRIEHGASLKVSTAGIELGEIQSQAKAVPQPDTRQHGELPHDVYMTHSALRAPHLDSKDLKFHVLRISLDADDPAILDGIEKVIYHLHPTFKDPDRSAIDRRNNFVIQTAAWGEFNMTAEIFFTGAEAPLVVERYINFGVVGAG